MSKEIEIEFEDVNSRHAKGYLKDYEDSRVRFLEYSQSPDEEERKLAPIHKLISEICLDLVKYYTSSSDRIDFLVEKLKELGALNSDLSEQYNSIAESTRSEYYHRIGLMHKMKSDSFYLTVVNINIDKHLH